MDFFKHYDEFDKLVALGEHEYPSRFDNAGVTTVDLLRLSSSDLDLGLNYLADSLGYDYNTSRTILDWIEGVCLKDLSDSEKPATDAPMTPPLLKETPLEHLTAGGIHEIAGLSGTGKSQLAYQICASVQAEYPDSHCIVVSTESQLETRKLSTILDRYGVPLMDSIFQIYCSDLMDFDHAIFNALPSLLDRLVSLKKAPTVLVIDSISHHIRGVDGFVDSQRFLRDKLNDQVKCLEDCGIYLEEGTAAKAYETFFKQSPGFLNYTSRAYYLMTLHKFLTKIGDRFDLSIIVTNQVSLHPQHESMGTLGFSQQMGILSKWSLDDITCIKPLQHDLKNGNSRSTSNETHHKNCLWSTRNLGSLYGNLWHSPCLGHTWSRLAQSRTLLRKYITEESNHSQIEVRTSVISNQITKKQLVATPIDIFGTENNVSTNFAHFFIADDGIHEAR